MKKVTAIFLSTITLASCTAGLSACGGDGIKFVLSEEGGKHYTVSCSALSSQTGEYEIPAYYGEGENYAPVTAIADEGFSGTRFTKIKVPATVTQIGNAAFSYCNLLETVEFDEGIQLEKFSHGLFGKSVNLKNIKIPDSVTTLEGLVFSDCTSLSSVELAGVESIGVRAFYNCTALEEITLPDTLARIDSLAFYCSGLTSVSLPDSVRDTETGEGEDKQVVYGLGYGAFNNCLKLESVKIGSGIKVIPSGAFGYCIALKEIYIPLSVQEIQGALYDKLEFKHGHAFYADKALTDVYFEGTAEQWKDIKIETKAAYENNMTMDNSALMNATKHYKEQ